MAPAPAMVGSDPFEDLTLATTASHVSGLGLGGSCCASTIARRQIVIPAMPGMDRQRTAFRAEHKRIDTGSYTAPCATAQCDVIDQGVRRVLQMQADRFANNGLTRR